jgi:hypothetical protein
MGSQWKAVASSLWWPPNGDRSCNSSSRYPIIGRPEASNARTPSADLARNLNLDFNAIQVQAVMEIIQRMALDDSPLAALAQEGAEAVNLIVAERTTGVPHREPLAGNNDRARHARSEAASSASSNCHLSEHDVRRRITQNRVARDDLRNVLEDRRHSRVSTPSPTRRYLVEDVALVGRCGFRDLVGPLRQVRWPEKFKTDNIDRYDGVQHS